MIHGSAYLAGIPWETIIKIYREELGETNFETLREFAEAFLAFLEGNSRLFPAQLRQTEVSRLAVWFLRTLKTDIDESVRNTIGDHGAISESEIQALIKEKVLSALKYLETAEPLDNFEPGFQEDFKEKYANVIDEAINQVFQNLPLEAIRSDLKTFSAVILTKEMWGPARGGLVLAGFGKSDIFPVIECYTVDAVIDKKLRYKRNSNQCHDMNAPGSEYATIIPFSQAEMVERFIRGVDPTYKSELTAFMRTLLTGEYPKAILERIGERIAEPDRRDFQAELIRIGRTVLEEFDNNWVQWEQRKFISPVLDIVTDLPKEDLSAMAESLVNLTSFKRKISAEAETVGGPIDVAVISKGDGFVWIKRKHYFDPSLNPGFLANYYRRKM